MARSRVQWRGPRRSFSTRQCAIGHATQRVLALSRPSPRKALELAGKTLVPRTLPESSPTGVRLESDWSPTGVRLESDSDCRVPASVCGWEEAGRAARGSVLARVLRGASVSAETFAAVCARSWRSFRRFRGSASVDPHRHSPSATASGRIARPRSLPPRMSLPALYALGLYTFATSALCFHHVVCLYLSPVCFDHIVSHVTLLSHV